MIVAVGLIEAGRPQIDLGFERGCMQALYVACVRNASIRFVARRIHCEGSGVKVSSGDSDHEVKAEYGVRSEGPRIHFGITTLLMDHDHHMFQFAGLLNCPA